MGKCFSTLQTRTFHEELMELLRELSQDQELPSPRQRVGDFIQEHEITTENIWIEYNLLEAPMRLPLETAERRFVLDLNTFMGSNECNQKALDHVLKSSRSVFRYLQDKSKSEDELDRDLYAYMYGALCDIFVGTDRFALDNLLLHTLEKREENSHIEYRTVQDSLILSEVHNTIWNLLHNLRDAQTCHNVLESYSYLDLKYSDLTSNMNNELPPDNDVINHLFSIVPQKVLVIDDGSLPGLDGICLLTKTVVIRRSLLDESEADREINIAKTMVTILREMGHLNAEKYFRPTPETILHKRVREAGYFVEEGLFGIALDLSKMNSDTAKLILDLENYTNPVKYAQLKTSLQPMSSEGFRRGNFQRSREGGVRNKETRCKVHRLGLEFIHPFEAANP